MQEKTDALTDLIVFFSRTGTWIISLFVGVMAKISSEILNSRKLSMWQWIAVVGVSIFFGYMAHQYCEAKTMGTSEGYIVPIVTLFGERIMVYLTRNFKAIAAKILGIENKNK